MGVPPKRRVNSKILKQRKQMFDNQRGIQVEVCKTTGKRGYARLIDAKITLANISHTANSRRYRCEKRFYRCGFCNNYHLTSQNMRKGKCFEK